MMSVCAVMEIRIQQLETCTFQNTMYRVQNHPQTFPTLQGFAMYKSMVL